MEPTPNYYRVLQVSEQATQEQIANAYERLSKRYNPQNNPKLEDYHQQLQEAYDVLGNEESRAAYDRELGGYTAETTYSHNNPSPRRPRAQADKPQFSPGARAGVAIVTTLLILGAIVVPTWLYLNQSKADYRKGKLAYETGQYGTASLYLNKAMVWQGPRNFEAALLLARICREQGSMDNWMVYSLMAVEESSNDEEKGKALAALGNGAYQQEQYEKAEDFYLEALALRPGHDSTLVNLAATYRAQYKQTEAREALAKANQASPNNFQIMLAYAEVLIVEKEYKQALALLDSCKAIDYDAGGPYYWEATINVAKNNKLRACALFAEAYARGHRESGRMLDTYCANNRSPIN